MPRRTHRAIVQYDGGVLHLNLGSESDGTAHLCRALVFDSALGAELDPDWQDRVSMSVSEFVAQFPDVVAPEPSESGDVFCLKVDGQWICLD